METFIKSLESNLNSVTEMAQNQVVEINKLKEEIAKLQAVNEKLTKELKYEANMKEAYKAELNNMKITGV